eukprot:1073518-Lingulodinium_polyedra.AAC.1
MYAFHASTTTRRSTHGTRTLRNARRRNNGMRVGAHVQAARACELLRNALRTALRCCGDAHFA